MSRVEKLLLSEICLSLQSEEKSKRLKALQKFQKIIYNDEDNWSKAEFMEMWQVMSKHIAKHLTDSAESCRNLSIEITQKFLESLPVHEKNIIYLMPVLVRRLGAQEILEPSEEVRLNCVILLQVLIKFYKEHLSVYVDDLMTIFTRTIVDNYPKVKTESCEAVSELAKAIPVQFYSKSEGIIKPILSNFNHQHHKVRVASILAIGNVLLHGNSKPMPDVASAMAARLFDQSGAVRRAVIEVAGNWLLNLRDRYSWWYKLVPLLITGLHDEIPEIRVKSHELWDAAGIQFLTENESDEKIKDKMDYLISDPEHYPPNIERPNLGCRLIVQQNIGKLVPGLCRELDDWMADICVRSAQLLAVLVLNAEQDTIQHIERLLPAMYKACTNEDHRVTINVVTAAEYMGYFVPPDVYCRLVLPTLEDGNIHFGHLTVFAAILRGSERKSLLQELGNIGSFLRQPYICQSKKPQYQEQLLKCCEALLVICQEDCSTIANDLFTTIFTAWSMTQSPSLQELSKKLMEMLSKIENTKDLEDLYICHLPSILHNIKETTSSWTIHSAELCIFKLCLTEGKTAALQNIDIILPILKVIIVESDDPELKLKVFILLSELFLHRKECLRQMQDLNAFLVEFLRDILMPSLVWTAGRSAEALRTAAVGCLCALLDETPENDDINSNLPESDDNASIFYDEPVFLSIFKDLRPTLVSLIDDNSRKTRLFALRALYLIMKNAKRLCCIVDEDVIGTYPAVMKRLDDGCDEVRSAAIETLVLVWKTLPQDYDIEFGKSHVDYLYTSALVHLDDPEKHFQQLMLDAMMDLAKIHPALLADKIQKSKMNFRNQSALEKLENQCHNLLKLQSNHRN